MAHDVEFFCQDDKDDSDVFGEGEEELAEVVVFDGGLFAVEFAYFGEAEADGCCGVAESFANGVFVDFRVLHYPTEHCGDDGGSAKPNFVDNDN